MSSLLSLQVSILVRDQLIERAHDFFIILDDVSIVSSLVYLAGHIVEEEECMYLNLCLLSCLPSCLPSCLLISDPERNGS